MQRKEDIDVNHAKSTSRHEDRATAPVARTMTLGKYRLLARLGHGGMAEVYLAVAQGAMNVNRLVVVKRLRDEQSEDENARDMFLDEARLAARLTHANVVQTFEAGSEDGSYYLAMEYVDGQPLSRLLNAQKRAGEPMDPMLAARICADALQGLHYAHEATDFDGTRLEIVHRDVSPQNIMLTYDGVVKIVDFGIAKAAGTAQTEHGVFKGKVAFMAPEQLLGGQVDRRVDVFAAGIVLWEAVTGRHLFADETPAKTLYNLVNKVIPRASELRADLPPALDDVLAKALERDASRRYATAREMRDALEKFIDESGGVHAEQVGALVTRHFADTRGKVQNEIKAQLAALAIGRNASLHGNSFSSGTHMRAPSVTLVDLSDATAIRTASTSGQGFRVVTTASIVMPPPSRTKRVAFALWIAVTLAAAGASGLAIVRSQHAGVMPVVAPAIAAPPVVAAAPAPEPPRAPAPVASEHAAAPATGTTSAVSAVSVPTSAVTSNAWRPPVVTARPATTSMSVPAATASAEAPRPSPSPAPPPSAKPAETSTGRTFRRDL